MGNKANGTKEDKKLNILHSTNNYYVSNEGTKKTPLYYVWIPNGTHVVSDSAYVELELAVCRCNYLSKRKTTIGS